MAMTIRDLISQLQDFADEYGEDTEVRLAHQPNWPFEYGIDQLVAVDPKREEIEEFRSILDGLHVVEDAEKIAEIKQAIADEEKKIEEEGSGAIVYIGEASQIGYLPGYVSRELGWK